MAGKAGKPRGPQGPRDPESRAAMEVARADRRAGGGDEQALRERLALECGEALGRIQGITIVRKFADVGGLLWLKQVKETKAYKDVPGIGTWENFCKRAGLSRQHTDEALSNIEALGEDFLLTVGGFGLGYRDIRRLRQLTHEGGVEVKNGLVTIGDLEIPLAPEHAEDLQTALTDILAEKDSVIAETEKEKRAKDRLIRVKDDHIDKLTLALEGEASEARAKGLTPDQGRFAKDMEAFKKRADMILSQLSPEEFAVKPLDAQMKSEYLALVRYIANRASGMLHEAEAICGFSEPEA